MVISGLVDELRFTCKSLEKESGPEGTRTPDLRHARAARRFAGVFRCVQNACKWQHSDESTFPSISGDSPGLLHGCCTDGKACMRARSGMIAIRPTALRPFM